MVLPCHGQDRLRSQRRLKVEDVIEEYTQEILGNWDDSPP